MSAPYRPRARPCAGTPLAGAVSDPAGAVAGLGVRWRERLKARALVSDLIGVGLMGPTMVRRHLPEARLTERETR